MFIWAKQYYDNKRYNYNFKHIELCIHVAPTSSTLRWHHNDHDVVSNHQPHGCLLNRLFKRRSKKTSKLRVTGLCAGNSPGPVNSPHKGPVTRKMFPFDDVIMNPSFLVLPDINNSVWGPLYFPYSQLVSITIAHIHIYVTECVTGYNISVWFREYG